MCDVTPDVRGGETSAIGSECPTVNREARAGAAGVLCCSEDWDAVEAVVTIVVSGATTCQAR